MKDESGKDHSGKTLDQAFQAFCEAWIDGARPDPEAWSRKYSSFGPELAARIDEFLFVTQGLKSRSEKGPVGPPMPAAEDSKVRGMRLGDFSIIREIGRGGMGVVYDARQISLKRNVALKVLPAHLTLRKESVERFKREASFAARLNHPGIVDIYAVGEEGGTHYFAMEFVEGTPLDRVIARFRKEGSLPVDGSEVARIVAERRHRPDRISGAGEAAEESEAHLEDGEKKDETHSKVWNKTFIESACRMVTQVADALDYAHRAGVIHRDVKPSNILVRGNGTCVLTDFGLAREEGLPSVTVTGEFAGTPHYVSPEQAMPRRRKVDDRSDIYSLGVTLYELLTLKRPFDGKTAQEVLGKIISKEPPLLRAQNSLIPRDLEKICMSALEKDPVRRYQSAGEFRDDIQRFLDFKPVKARPVGVVRRTWRLIRRNPTYAALGLVLFLLVVVGPLSFAFQQKLSNIRIREALEEKKLALERAEREQEAKEEALGRADEAAKRAVREAETAKQVCDFLVELFKVVDPSEARGRTITAFEILQQSAELSRLRLAESPEVQARLLETLGLVYRALGLYSEAEPLLENTMATHIERQGEDHPSTLKSMVDLATLYRLQGQFESAEPLFARALEGCRRVLGEAHPDTLAVMNGTAMLFERQFRYEDAEPLYVKTLELRRRVLGADHADTLETMNNLAYLYMHQGRYEDAEPLYLKTLEGRRSLLGSDHPDTIDTLNTLAVLYSKQGRYSRAEPLYFEAIELWSRILGEEHPDTITSLFRLAIFYKNQNRYDEAAPLFEKVWEQRYRILGEEHPKTLIALTCLAIIHHEQGRLDEAESLYVKALEAQMRTLGTKHQFTLATKSRLSRLYFDQGLVEKAEPLARDAYRMTHPKDPEYVSRKEFYEELSRVMEAGN
jgi:serine/threonine protein kinase/tetratricopeptide (TPR) repeat protein